MPRQAGEFRITGTIDDLCFYRMYEEYFVRMKSSLTGKRFWKDNAFEGSRRSCRRFGKGNRIASRVYRMTDEDKRLYKLFCFLKRKAILLLKEGMSPEGTEGLLIDYLTEFGMIKRRKREERTNQNIQKVERTIVQEGFKGITEMEWSTSAAADISFCVEPGYRFTRGQPWEEFT